MATLERVTPANQHRHGILRPFARQNGAIGLAVAGLVIVVAFGLVPAKWPVVVRAELAVDQAVSRAHIAPVTDVALAIDWLFSPLHAIILTMAITGIVIWATARIRPALTFAIVVAVGWLSSAVLKVVIHRPRPDAHALAHPFLPTPTDFSYPSGHTVFAASLAFALILLARGTRWHGPALVLGGIGAIVVALSRVYLGVHYPSDVVASLVWAPSMGTLVFVVLHRSSPPTLEPDEDR